jgi:hypothetical protein
LDGDQLRDTAQILGLVRIEKDQQTIVARVLFAGGQHDLGLKTGCDLPFERARRRRPDGRFKPAVCNTADSRIRSINGEVEKYLERRAHLFLSEKTSDERVAALTKICLSFVGGEPAPNVDRLVETVFTYEQCDERRLESRQTGGKPSDPIQVSIEKNPGGCCRAIGKRRRITFNGFPDLNECFVGAAIA